MADKKYVSKLTVEGQDLYIKDLEAQAAAVHLEEKELTEEEAKVLAKKYVLVNAEGDEVKTTKVDAETGDTVEEVVYIEVPKDKVIENAELYTAMAEPVAPVEPVEPIEPDPIDEDTASEEEKAEYAEKKAKYDADKAKYDVDKAAYDEAKAQYDADMEVFAEVSAADAEAGLEAGKTYLKITIANQEDPIYVPVESLVESQEAVYDEEEQSLELVGFKFKTL